MMDVLALLEVVERCLAGKGDVLASPHDIVGDDFSLDVAFEDAHAGLDDVLKDPHVDDPDVVVHVVHLGDVHLLPDVDRYDVDVHLVDVRLLAPDGDRLDDGSLEDCDVDPMDLVVTDFDEEAVVHLLVNDLVDVLGLSWGWQLACCRCSGVLHDGLLDVDGVETILRKMLDLDDSILRQAAILLDDVANDDATPDVVGYPIPDVDASHDVVDDYPSVDADAIHSEVPPVLLGIS